MNNSRLLDFIHNEEIETQKYANRNESETFTKVESQSEISTERLDNFLENYNFYSNSIDLRIQSSKSIEHFKNVQSFQLNQIANGNFHFNKDRKEILLLKYDMWTRWLYEVENFLIEMSSDFPDLILEQQHIDYIVKLCEKTSKKYKETIDKQFQYFNKEFARIWLSAHEIAYELLVLKIKSLVGYKFSLGFSVITNNLIEIMQYTLIELHELNGLYQYFRDQNGLCKHPFLIFTSLDKVCKKLTNKHLIIRRLKTYKEHFDITELYIKNYSEDQFDSEIFDKIEELGIKINYRMNF